MKNLMFIYLARRDKKGIKCIASFEYDKKCFPSKINLESSIGSNDIKKIIREEISKNKYIYEIYAETASSFVELKKSLFKRGYRNLPLQQLNLILNSNQIINENHLITEKNIMLRKKSN